MKHHPEVHSAAQVGIHKKQGKHNQQANHLVLLPEKCGLHEMKINAPWVGARTVNGM